MRVMQMRDTIERLKKECMPTPTLAVTWREYYKIAVLREPVFYLHGARRGLKIVPPVAQELDDNLVIFTTAPREIVFRKIFTTSKCKRSVSTIMADNSNRYDIVFKITFSD